MQIVFATGIHGIGKTTLCSVISDALHLPFFTASTLIRDARGDSQVLKKLNPEIEENAQHFKRAVQELVNAHDCLLIDGHTVLLTESGSCHRVSRTVFEELPITCFLILYNEVGLIRSRLTSIDTLELSEQTLTEFQNEELLYALSLAGDMRCDVIVARTSEDPQSIIERLLRTQALTSGSKG